jgi:hypothetical protein
MDVSTPHARRLCLHIPDLAHVTAVRMRDLLFQLRELWRPPQQQTGFGRVADKYRRVTWTPVDTSPSAPVVRSIFPLSSPPPRPKSRGRCRD